jgi:aminoglycoside 3-N-acetyltransferase
MGGRYVDTQEARDRIAEGLLVAGVRPGGVILVHSSLKSMGHVPGGPETVILGLLQALGREGTLLLPGLSFSTVNADNPVFDVRHTPSCVGAIPEYFRTREGTRRSVHPTHSVCGVGPLAEELLSRNHLDTTPCGPNSPFRLLRDAGGQVVMLGCGLSPNTSMHAVEEIAEAPYLLGPTFAYDITFADGSTTVMHVRRHHFVRLGQRYDRLGALMPPEALHVGQVLEATTHVIECPAMWEIGEAAIRQDPYHFVEPMVTE